MKKIIVGALILFLFVTSLFLLMRIDIHLSTGADVAIYSDRGAWNDSVVALEHIVRWMNCTFELVDAQYINDNGLTAFHALCVPGGDMFAYGQDLSVNGKDNIRTFVYNGGGYIGICGGAYFAAEKVFWRGNELPMTALALFPGTAEGPIDAIMPYPNYTMCTVNIINHTHSITQLDPDNETMLYYGGPALVPNDTANVTVLGNYAKGDMPAMVTSEYHQGRVFLVGTHPEIEEGSNRDGTSFGDELQDQGSEWPIMQRAFLWCMQMTEQVAQINP
jgi:glutamine amidotransferase-like uncharacterized protein